MKSCNVCGYLYNREGPENAGRIRSPRANTPALADPMAPLQPPEVGARPPEAVRFSMIRMSDNRNPDSVHRPPHPLPTHLALLGTRLQLHTYIRLLIAAIIVSGTLIASHVVGVENLNTTGLYFLAAVIAIYDVAGSLIIRYHRQPERSANAYKRLVVITYCAIVLDFLSLTVATWLVGGSRSPFLAFYLVHVMLSCVMLSRGAAVTFSALAYGLLAGLVIGEWLGVIPPQVPGGVTAGTGPLDGRYVLTLLVVYGLLFSVIAFLLLTLTELLRQGEGDMREANAKLERLSDIRRDFLHIALHNLQSPVGAVTMFLNNLSAGLGGPINEQQEQWVKRALRRLDGLSDFMKDLQFLSTLESGGIEAQSTPIDIPEMLKSLVEEYRDQAESGEHTVTLDMPEAVPTVVGIERLIREAVANYLTNAIKYTAPGGEIVIRVSKMWPMVRIDVTDSGVGIAAEDLDKVFHEFVRIRQIDPAMSKVKGSGLGLSIVRRVIEAHGGRVDVASRVNEGSTFTIELPASAS